jgi:ABC-type nitrate/sulfonate/bicarbonate transport system permease component
MAWRESPWVLRSILPVLLLAVWWSVSASTPDIASVLPSPDRVVVALFKEAISGDLVGHILASLERAFGGFVIAAIIGIGLGLLMSQFRLARQLLAGPVELLRPISSIAWIPLAILWFGLGYQSVVFVIAISCLFIILLNTLAAAMRVDPDLTKAALALGANRGVLFSRVVVPSAMPGTLLGLRIAMQGAWGGVLVAEMIATQQGLGYMMARAQAAFNAELLIGSMVIVGVIGYLLNILFHWFERKVTHA